MNIASVTSATALLILLIVIAFFVLPPTGMNADSPTIAEATQSLLPIAEDLPEEAGAGEPVMGNVDEALSVVPSREASVMPEAPQADQPLPGEVIHQLADHRWVLMWLDGVNVPNGDRAPNIVFEMAEQRVSGYAGCNRYAGTVELDDATIAFGPMTTTRMACDQLALEGAYLSALGNISTWRLVKGELVLRDAQGDDIARFRAP